MSTATPFRFKQPFPFCIGSAASTGSDSVSNLTLAQVMPFFWNLETVTFTTTGTATTGFGVTTNCASTASLNPVTSSTPFTIGGSEGCWYGNVSYPTALGSFPVFKTPIERVCAAITSSGFGEIANFQMDYSAVPNFAQFYMNFNIGNDPVNTGKYVLLYFFQFRFDHSAGAAIEMANPNGASGTVLASGTLSIGGITLNYEITDVASLVVSSSGLGIGVADGFFTY